jgi:hypothetical protein
MRRNGHLMRSGDRMAIAALLALTLLASGCSGSSLLGSSPATTGSTTPAPASASSPSTMDKISNFFSNSTATSPQTVAGAAQEIECPLINIRQGASTLTIGQTAASTGDVTNTNNGAMAVRYQGTFVRAARECAVAGNDVVMRIGVEGRIIVGPAGGPGQINVPLRMAVVDETPNKTKPIVTRFVQIPVTIASPTDNPNFTHIEEGLSFPIPRDIDRYVVYIGFDPLAAQAQEHAKPKPTARPKAKTKPTAPPQ